MFRRERGMFLPVIDEEACVQCGLCAAVCPGLGHPYEPKETAEATIIGTVLECCNAWSKDAQIRYVSASGGVISTLIPALLQQGYYDGAFCLDSYDYREQLKTRLYTTEEIVHCWSQSNAPKSRYLPVSHENAVSYMKQNREARLIIVGTSCAVRGLQNTIKKLNLDRSQYLFIGLFCDKVFNYNVHSYFADQYAQGTALAGLHFKNKESGGWPGDMKFYPEVGEPFYVPLAERAKAKAYFMPERCLYCVDKLNVYADISLGDNYTGKDESSLGSNSVIIRTQAGKAAWNAVTDKLETRDISIDEIQKAQGLDWRLNNLYFSDFRAAELGKDFDINQGVPREKAYSDFESSWKKARQQLRTGAIYDVDPTQLEKQIKKDNRKPNPVIRFIRRAAGYVKHRLMA